MLSSALSVKEQALIFVEALQTSFDMEVPIFPEQETRKEKDLQNYKMYLWFVALEFYEKGREERSSIIVIHEDAGIVVQSEQ